MHMPILGGREVDSDSSFEVLNPFDGSLVGRVGCCGQAQVEAALALAHGARQEAAGLTRSERASILSKVSERLRQRKEDLALILAREVGKTIGEARGEVERASTTFAFAADEAKRLGGQIIPFDAVPGGIHRRGFSLKKPLGTVVAITPFNFPLNLAAHKVAPAMAAGNPFVLKPASQTPLADLELGKIVVEAGWPAEAVSVLPGPGRTLGMELVRDPRPRMVTFTGSLEVGKEIARNAGFKRIAMELGSNSGIIVAPSADADFACARIVQGAFALAGQVCISVQRVVVQEALFRRLVDGVCRLASELRVGDQLQESTQMGPMISVRDAKRLREWVEEAADAGAVIEAGGEYQGSLYQPTVITGVPAETRVWKEEAFGPVVCINPYGDFQEALAAINDSRYGLQAGVFTNSLTEAFRAADELEVGGVIINDYPTYRVDHMPYGGVKDSGLGREGLRYAIEEMTEEKLVCFNFWRPE